MLWKKQPECFIFIWSLRKFEIIRKAKRSLCKSLMDSKAACNKSKTNK